MTIFHQPNLEWISDTGLLCDRFHISDVDVCRNLYLRIQSFVLGNQQDDELDSYFGCSSAVELEKYYFALQSISLGWGGLDQDGFSQDTLNVQSVDSLLHPLVKILILFLRCEPQGTYWITSYAPGAFRNILVIRGDEAYDEDLKDFAENSIENTSS